MTLFVHQTRGAGSVPAALKIFIHLQHFFDIFIISSLQTHEEAIADLLVDAGPISYKQLPFTLYQVQKYLYFFLRFMLYHVSHIQQYRQREPSVKTLFIYSIYFPKWESIPQPSL